MIGLIQGNNIEENGALAMAKASIKRSVLGVSLATAADVSDVEEQLPIMSEAQLHERGQDEVGIA